MTTEKIKISKIKDEEIYFELENEFNLLSAQKGNEDLLLKKNFASKYSKNSDFFFEKSNELYNHDLEKIRKKNKLLDFIVVFLI